MGSGETKPPREELLKQLEHERSARQTAETAHAQRGDALRSALGKLSQERRKLELRVEDRTRELVEINAKFERKTRFLQVINSFAISLLHQRTLEEVVWDVARNAVAQMGLEDCVIYLLDEDEGVLIQVAAHGTKNPTQLDILDPITISLGEGVVGSVAVSGVPEIVDDTREDARYIEDDRFRFSELAVPIIYEDEVIGVIDSEHPEANFYTEDHLQLFTTIAALASAKIADALNAKKLQATIGDLKRTETELELARQAAERASEHKSEFLANMSHEIRTPLNGVLGLNSLLLQTELSVEQQDYAEIIRESGESLLCIINDILDFSKIEAGKLELEVQPFDIAECMRHTVALMRPASEKKGLEILCEVDDGVPRHIVGDVTRMQQVFTNLIGNAVKFTSTGHVALSVRATPGMATHPDALQTLHFAVEDTGIGIPEDRRQRLFQPFSQVDASTTRQFGGTGLGLAICKRLTKMLGGTIWVEGRPGGGTVFRFTIQAHPAHVTHTRQGAGAKAVDPTQADRHPLRILIAEDNLVNQKVTLGMLKRLGYDAEVAITGIEVLDRLDRQSFDVILMDSHMPEMDGPEASRQIRNGPPDKQPYIIAFTADALSGDRERFLNAGMDDYITKPIAIERLAAALQACPPRDSPRTAC
jgi:signal transduction histidine kinase/CheY-like chemotaxis protein